MNAVIKELTNMMYDILVNIENTKSPALLVFKFWWFCLMFLITWTLAAIVFPIIIGWNLIKFTFKKLHGN